MTLEYTRIADEVLYTTQVVTRIDRSDIATLKAMAKANARRRVRLCAHPGTEDALHEMLIVHARGNYVPPHRHPGKSESYHVIEGELDVLVFDDAGTVIDVVGLGAPDGAKPFYYRLSAPRFHTVIPRTDWVVFHEITNGPFRREETIFAPWAPGENAPPEDQQARLAAWLGESPR